MWCLLVITKMVLSSESFLTNVAFEWPFVCVSSFVDHKIVALCEFTLAESENKGLFLWLYINETYLQICCFFGLVFLFVTVLSTVADSANLWKSNFFAFELFGFIEDMEEKIVGTAAPWMFIIAWGVWRIWLRIFCWYWSNCKWLR